MISLTDNIIGIRSRRDVRMGVVLLFACFWMTPTIRADGDKPQPKNQLTRTTNLSLRPRWVDERHFWFARENDIGEREIVDVDASTGEMTVRASGGDQDSDSPPGLEGGPVFPSDSRSDTEVQLVFENRSAKSVEARWVDSSGRRVSYATIRPGQKHRQHTFVGHRWEVVGEDGKFYGSLVATPDSVVVVEKVYPRPKGSKRRKPKRSSRRDDVVSVGDATLAIREGRLVRRDSDATDPDDAVTHDRDDDREIDPAVDASTPSKSWTPVTKINAILKEAEQWSDLTVSPDEKFLVLWKQRSAFDLKVHTIESSPPGGGRAVLHEHDYRLPGDEFDSYECCVFAVEDFEPVELDLPSIDFGRPQSRWRGDDQLLVQKVDRGHQRFRLFKVDLSDRVVSTPIDETSETFLWTAHYSQVPLLTFLAGNSEVIYASEKSGFRHLYLVDLDDEGPMQPITEGPFVVREMLHLDEETRTLDLIVGGLHPDQDPYHRHLIRTSLDQADFQTITSSDGDHRFQFSPDRRFVVVDHSRVDRPPVHELRSMSDGKLIATLAKSQRPADSDRQKPLPKIFTAKGRDGVTDIWGLIHFPVGYETASIEQYPVIEKIYAGPHGSHVPKRYSDTPGSKDLTDLGFVVVQIDGMGTANRSKAFHDVCWQNLKDAGFPDRIAWMRSAAEVFPCMDLNRVGIYGTSAGGQNAMGALLFHGDFYHAAMAACGCHDNRMDKASWNEQWMGYPVGPHYSHCSNVDQAHRLQGDLLLIVGELDTNVPPESTLRVVDALVKADKDFEFLMIPGMGHSSGGAYGWRRTKEFFVRSLKPPGPESSDIMPAAMTTEPRTEELNQKTMEPDKIAAERPMTTAAIELNDFDRESRWQRELVRFEADLGSLQRRHPLIVSLPRHQLLKSFLAKWQRFVTEQESTGQPSPTEPASTKAAWDTLLHRMDETRRQIEEQIELSQLLARRYPLLKDLSELIALSNRGRGLEYAEVAAQLERIDQDIDDQLLVNSSDEQERDGDALDATAELKKNVADQFQSWRNFYADYDPQFDWWCHQTAELVESKLQRWAAGREKAITSKEKHRPPKEWVGTNKTADNIDFPQPPIAKVFRDGYPAVPSEALIGSPVMPNIVRGFAEAFANENGNRADSTNASDKSVVNDVRQRLLDWRQALVSYEPDGHPYSRWSVNDQVDYHILLRDIDVRLRRLELGQTPPIYVTAADGSGLSGVAVGSERLRAELTSEFIADSPEDLIELAEKELSDCHAMMSEIATDLGFGDDWQAAVDEMKNRHLDPGHQPKLIRETAEQSVEFLKSLDLITIDPLAEHSWKMQMMSPERQRINPFFTGGETISISFPTRQMSLSEKRQSLRGNNIPFVRTTVQHELIPGHHLQQYQNARFQTHRRSLATPFWLEGWAVYWEYVFEENGFPQDAWERLGFLVWRSHRFARIIFSLRFHLGQMSPDQCVSFLVDNVGFDRRNATAEVRRSIGPDYPPLYQAAYMLGAMQFRQLRSQWVAAGRPIKDFHDAIMRHNSVPPSLLANLLWERPLERTEDPAFSLIP